MRRFRRFFHWLLPLLPYLNIALVGAAYIANQYWVQGFCQPVEWAAWVLAVSTSAFLAWPWLGTAPHWLRMLAWFLQGLFLTVCLYCALFIALDPSLYLWSAFFCWMGYPLLLWMPVFFIWQLKRRMPEIPISQARAIFLLGALSLSPFYFIVQVQLFQLERALAGAHIGQITYVEDLARALPRSYATERVLGLAWRYHTSPEFIFDGWRPPLHDPMINMALLGPANWFWTKPFPPMTIREEAEVYRLVFPDQPTKAGCVCAHIRDAEEYLDWAPELNDPKGDTTRTGRGGLFGIDATAINQ